MTEDGGVLPVDYAAGRFYVCPVTTEGDRLRLFTDTGGGLFITTSAAERLKLRTETVTLDGQTLTLVEMPEFRAHTAIPTISIDADPRPEPLRGRLFVYEDDERLSVGDGLLGQIWFGGRVWTFDYPAKELRFHGDAKAVSVGDHAVRLGFPVAGSGRRSAHFPSIDATIDGETHAFLFDTGATVRLTQEALYAIGGGPSERGTCFVTSSVFASWRARHPDWRVVPNADANLGGEPMIEVPSVQIAGHTVGPVWFTRRADANFHEYMSGMMDRRVEGALGSSLFEYFQVTVDYPSAVASFERK